MVPTGLYVPNLNFGHWSLGLGALLPVSIHGFEDFRKPAKHTSVVYGVKLWYTYFCVYQTKNLKNYG